MNTNITPAFHGSDLEKIAAYYHIPQESIINFGANVNPLGLSPSVKSALAPWSLVPPTQNTKENFP